MTQSTFAVLFLRDDAMSEILPIVYFDGLCRLCSREIEHYRRCAGSDQLLFVDICAPGFRPGDHGLDPHEVHKNMHVRRVDGTMAVGVDAFIAIWSALPRYRMLPKFANAFGIRSVLNIGYRIFASVRPFLPRRRVALDDCTASPYCAMPPKSKSKTSSK